MDPFTNWTVRVWLSGSYSYDWRCEDWAIGMSIFALVNAGVGALLISIHPLGILTFSLFLNHRVAAGIGCDPGAAEIVGIPLQKRHQDKPEAHDTVIVATVAGLKRLHELVALQARHLLHEKWGTDLDIAVAQQLDEQLDHAVPEPTGRVDTNLVIAG